MAHHKSAQKRIRQSLKRREQNRTAKGALRTAIKKFNAALDKEPDEAGRLLADAIPVISKAASKGLIHKNNASRNISKLTRKLNKALAAK